MTRWTCERMKVAELLLLLLKKIPPATLDMKRNRMTKKILDGFKLIVFLYLLSVKLFDRSLRDDDDIHVD